MNMFAMKEKRSLPAAASRSRLSRFSSRGAESKAEHSGIREILRSAPVPANISSISSGPSGTGMAYTSALPTRHAISSVRITALGFTGDHAVTSVRGGLGSAIGAQIDSPDGSTPVWTAGQWLSSMVSYNHATAPTMFARFQVQPFLPVPLSGVSIRALSGGSVVGRATGLMIRGATIESTPGLGQVTGIGGGSAIPGTGVGMYFPRIDFQASTDGGATWANAGSVRCQMSFTQRTPVPPGGRLREDVLFYGGLAARVAATPLLGLRSLVHRVVIYSSVAGMPSNYTSSDAVMSAFAGNQQCDTHAYLLRFLAMSFGIPADVLYFWYGTRGSVWLYTAGNYWVSFQCDRPKEDNEGAHPHFVYHAFTKVAGVMHDPTYGLSSLPKILKHVPRARPQLGGRGAYRSALGSKVFFR